MESVKKYTESFKREVCELYKTGNYSKSELRRQFRIGGKCTISDWLLKFENVHLPPKILPKSKPKDLDASDARELALFKTKLAEAELKVEAYERLIINAEKHFKIDIVKKGSTK